MKYFLFIVFSVILFGCKKDNDDEPLNQTVEVTYIIETTVTGFSEVKYMEWERTNGHAYKTWPITSPGTYTVKTNIPKGTGAEISARHPSSNSFKVILKGSDGSIINESTTITFYAGPPSYYYGRALGTAK